MRPEDLELLSENKSLANILLVDKFMKKKKIEKELLDIINELYVSHDRLCSMIDDYYKIKAEKIVRNVSIAKEYLKASVAASTGLACAALMGYDPSLFTVAYALNATIAGGFTLSKVNKDRIPDYSLDYNDRVLLKSDYEAEDKYLTELLNAYIYKILEYLPYFSLSDNYSFMDIIRNIIKNNSEYIITKKKNGDYSSEFNYKNIYDMHDDLLENITIFNNLVATLKEKYDENGELKVRISNKSKK